MAMHDAAGLVTYPAMGQTNLGGPTATSTKVLNLSRAHINLGQPGVGQQQQQQQQPTYYAQPSQSPVMAQPVGYSSSFQSPPPPSPQFHQRTSLIQPQVYTVGASQPMQQQQPQQFRVITAPQQASGDQTKTVFYTSGQPGTPTGYGGQTGAVYLGQQQQQQPSYQSMQHPMQQQYTTYPQQQTGQLPQQQIQQQPYQQPSGQVIFAQPAAIKPSVAQPLTFQTQAPTGSGQAGGVVLANQHPMQSQPISMQSSQHWVMPAPASTTYDQAYQQPSRQFSSTGGWVGQAQVSPEPASQFGAAYTGLQHASAVQPQPTTTFYSQPYSSVQGIQQVPTQFKPPTQDRFQSGETPIASYQQPDHQSRPPLPRGQPEFDQVRRRPPSVTGPTRTIKVKSLPMRNSASVDAIDVAAGPPQIVQHPVAQLTVNEGEPVTVTSCVRPAGDSSLNVEWFKNGKPLSASSRFSTIFDRGYAVLEFIYTNEDDSGDYSCVATNNCGQDQSSGCRITVIPEETVVTDTQLPEESMVANLAAMEHQMMQNGLARGARYRDEPKAFYPPQFAKPLSPQVGLREAAPAHFETVIEPANDASLSVEWYKDGKPVSMGCRFNSILDRGFAVLDILYCYPEDNGSYWCVAKNSVGEVQSNVVELQCSAEASIVTNSVLSKESISYLKSLDDWGSEQMAGYDRPQILEEETPCAPSFDVLPTVVTATEGSPAKFMVKASGFPRPKFLWYVDGELMASHGGGGNWRIYQDGGISHLEFNRVGNPGQQHIRAVARNNLGEVAAETILVVEPQLDFRPDLRHVQPENPFKKLAHLKRVERTHELTSALSKPKPQALDLRRIERQAEFKGRSAAEAESIEAENLYSRVQAQLRTSRRSSLQPPTPPPPTKLQPVNLPPQQQTYTKPPSQAAMQPPPQQQVYQPPPKPAPPPVQAVPPPMRPPAPAAVPAPPPPAPPQPQKHPQVMPFIPPPPPTPPAAPPAPAQHVMNAMATHQMASSPMQAQTEYQHDEVSAEFTIML